MASGPDEPNVDFVGSALDFFRNQEATAQAELAAIAASLFYEPAVDGETKFLIAMPPIMGVKQYDRVYMGSRYWVRYRYDGATNPPTLTVFDCGTMSR